MGTLGRVSRHVFARNPQYMRLSPSRRSQQPVADRWGAAGGRTYVTAMHLLMLEVYYRYLPLFRLD